MQPRRNIDQERELVGILSQLPAVAVADLFRSAHLRLGRSRAAEEDGPPIRQLTAA